MGRVVFIFTSGSYLQWVASRFPALSACSAFCNSTNICRVAFIVPVNRPTLEICSTVNFTTRQVKQLTVGRPGEQTSNKIRPAFLFPLTTQVKISLPHRNIGSLFTKERLFSQQIQLSDVTTLCHELVSRLSKLQEQDAGHTRRCVTHRPPYVLRKDVCDHSDVRWTTV